VLAVAAVFVAVSMLPLEGLVERFASGLPMRVPCLGTVVSYGALALAIRAALGGFLVQGVVGHGLLTSS
jgi:hypothetical protein